MAPSQPPFLQLQKPSLQQVLAVAELVRRQSGAAAAAGEERCAELAAEVRRLREAAARPPSLHPLAQLVAAHPAAPGSADAAAGYGTGMAAAGLPDLDLTAQQDSLRLWHQACTLLPPQADDHALHQALAAAQRYTVLKELAEGPGRALPALAAMQRTPVAALLELAGDVLQAHAATAAGSEQRKEGQQSRDGQHDREGQQQLPACPPPSLGAAHGPLLAAAVAAAVRLCGWPGQGASDACYASLQRFCSLALHLASSPTLSHESAGSAPLADAPDAQPPGSNPAAAALIQTFPASAGAPSIDLGQPCCLVAQQVLTLLHGSPNAGMVLLSCAAPSTRDCMAALAAAVLGGPQNPPHGGSLGGSSSSALAGGSCPGSSGTQRAGSAGVAEEAALLAALHVLGQQLSAGLHRLPQWVQATGLSDSSFLEVCCACCLHTTAWRMLCVPALLWLPVAGRSHPSSLLCELG